MNKNYKAGFVGIIGLPNAGKSTFLNKIVNEKISIVTDKPQTTRKRVCGLITKDEGQIVFVDSPGVIKAHRGLNDFLQAEYTDVILNSDVLLVLLNLDEPRLENLDRVIDLANNSKKPWIVVVNKIDLPEKGRRLPLLKLKLSDFQVQIFEISALKEESLKIEKLVLPCLFDLLPESPAPLYDPELYTTETIRSLSAEIIRKYCFELLHQELPYQLAIRIRKFDESQKNRVDIFSDIVVSKENYKPMVIGHAGSVLKEIGTRSRIEIEELLGKKVFLKLEVVVRKNWVKNKRLMEDFGYVTES